MSWIEVETKLRVQNHRDVRKRIKEIAKFVRIENKIDDYYSLEKGKYPKKTLRIRYKGKKIEVNFKKSLSYGKGVHAKKEVEFKVSDLSNFFDFLENFGFGKWIRKEKRTELYKTKDRINIELNYVKKLGWFIEIEILCKKKDIEKSRRRIEEIRKALDIPESDIEKKGYTRELWNLSKKK